MGAAGLGGFLLGAATSFLAAAAGLLKAGIATVAFPFVKNFADDVAFEFCLFLDPLFYSLLPFCLTQLSVQKKLILRTFSHSGKN